MCHKIMLALLYQLQGSCSASPNYLFSATNQQQSLTLQVQNSHCSSQAGEGAQNQYSVTSGIPILFRLVLKHNSSQAGHHMELE